MNLKIKRYFLITFIGFSINACVEPIALETQNFEDVLVIEATLTDELKHHEISLTRTSPLENLSPEEEEEQEDFTPSAETNADVSIVDDNQNEYFFMETTPGTYLSTEKFKARPNTNYQLKITTSNGNNYTSRPTSLTQGSAIDELFATRTTYTGLDGIALLINNSNPQGSSKFYRYEYEETYKIVSPLSFPTNLVVTGGNNVREVPKTEEETICYNTEASNRIILANTNSFSENSLNRFLVRFIDSENPILAHRYSILVKQFAISNEVYNYYETLKDLSGSESIFSQNQPGFIPGNIISEDDPREKVIGIFSVASVSSKRIYFNYTDFFDFNEKRPAFGPNCTDPRTVGRVDIFALIPMLTSGNAKYYGSAVGVPPRWPFDSGSYFVVPTGCMDCRVYGSNKVPEFWEEE